MAQIIKHRRGNIISVKPLTARNAEFLVASGSISDLVGPFVLFGSPNAVDEGVAGAFYPVSKIYQGNIAPTISNITYGSILDGTPFHATSNNTLYILNNTGGGGNQALNLTGNINGNTISNVTITNLTSSFATITNLTASLEGTASQAINATTIGGVTLTGLTDNFINSSGDTINGDLIISGNLDVSGSITGNLTGTASYSTTASYAIYAIDSATAVSSSYSTTASYAETIEGQNLGDLDNRFINTTGDTMNGNLIVSGNIVSTGGISGSFYGDGSNLTNLITTLNISGDTGSDVIDLSVDTLIVNGIANEIETTVTGNTITIGLQDNITIQTASIVNNLDVGGDVTISGSLTVLGSATEIHISSSVVEINDNIIRLNAYLPFERYGGIEVMDSGSSNVSASFLWDSLNDYWLLLNANGSSSKLIGTTETPFGGETNLTTNTIPKATGNSTIGDSLLTDNGTTLVYATNKFTVTASNGNTLISGSLTLLDGGGSDTNAKSSRIMFRNSSNIVGYVSTSETTDVLDGILGYKTSNGALVFSVVIDGGSF